MAILLYLAKCGIWYGGLRLSMSVPLQLPLSWKAIAIESDAKYPVGGNPYYYTSRMQMCPQDVT